MTEAAAGKIRELLAEEGKTESGLRVFVQGGGCSGFQYGLMIEESGGVGDQLLYAMVNEAARVLEGVPHVESPKWMQRRLTLAGMRPINNANNASALTCDVNAFVDATPISGPACK